MSECAHCDHVEGRVFFPDGRVIYLLLCCWCGRREERPLVEREHGPHAAKLTPLPEPLSG